MSTLTNNKKRKIRLYNKKIGLCLIGVLSLGMIPILPSMDMGLNAQTLLPIVQTSSTATPEVNSQGIPTVGIQVEEKEHQRLELDIISKLRPSKAKVVKIEEMPIDIGGRTMKFATEEDNPTEYTVHNQPNINQQYADVRRIEGGTVYTIPEKWRSEFKSYMAYTAVHTTNSPQYRLLNSRNAYTDEYGLRMYKGRYCVAVGSGIARTIGTKLDIVLKNGTVILCVLGDQKADRETDSTHMYHKETDGSVVEFIVDNSVFQRVKDGSGTVNFIPGWGGKIDKIVVANQSR